MEGEPLGRASFGGDDEDVGVAVVLSGEGDPVSVGRELWRLLHSGGAGEPDGPSAGAGDFPQVSGEAEGDGVPAEGRAAEQHRVWPGVEGLVVSLRNGQK